MSLISGGRLAGELFNLGLSGVSSGDFIRGLSVEIQFRERLVVREGYMCNLSLGNCWSKRSPNVVIRASFNASDGVIMCLGELSEWPA